MRPKLVAENMFFEAVAFEVVRSASGRGAMFNCARLWTDVEK